MSASVEFANPFEEPDLNLDQALIWLSWRNAQFVNDASDLIGDERATWMSLRFRYGRLRQKPKAMPELIWMRPYDAEEALVRALQAKAIEPQPGRGWAGPIWFNRACYGHTLSSTRFIHRDGGGVDLGPERIEPRFDAARLLSVFPPRDLVAYEALLSQTDAPPVAIRVSSNSVEPKRRGRKPAYDWPRLKEFAFELLDHHGLPDPNDPELPSQEALVNAVLDHSEAKFRRQPSPSQARAHVKTWLEEYVRRP